MALLEGIAALVAKVASASTVAQATAGLGIAVAGVTGAGAAGVLPAPVQNTVAGAFEAVTPFEMPHPAGQRSDVPHTAGADDNQDDGPAAVPTVVTPAPAAPTTEAAEHESEHGEAVEHESEDDTESDDGPHQDRGGRTHASVATVESGDDSPTTSQAPETEDHSSERSSGSGHDGSRHGGDD